MKNAGISVFWPKKGRNPDPLVGLKLNGYEGTEELRKLVLVIEDSLRSSFPGVPVNRKPSANKIFEEEASQN